jgi:hypothetical protein
MCSRQVLLFRAVALSLLLWTVAPNGQAQVAAIGVSPSTVNVSSQTATTAFITFRGLGGGPGAPAAMPAEAYWCGEVVFAEPDRGRRCNPATIYRSQPAGLSQSQVAGGVFTDIMSVTPGVARSAYTAAQSGAGPTFYYVRRFVRAGQPDEYVAVALRLGSSATAPFSLIDVVVAFAGNPPILFLGTGAVPPPISAAMRYTGSGQLKGRWEIVGIGEELPLARDLLTEATLPLAERGTQRRYTELSRFNVYLPPTGQYTLKGPDISRLPNRTAGAYFVLLRIEASYDQRQTAGSAGQAGPTAEFAMPIARYIVGSSGNAISMRPIDAPVRLLLPSPVTRLRAGRAMDFAWEMEPNVLYYRLDIESEEGEIAVLSAIVPGTLTTYRAPPWLADRAGTKTLRWRVSAIDSVGNTVGVSIWNRLLPSP